ncbi:unnamed protein product, partial [marine sediment metagenome]
TLSAALLASESFHLQSLNLPVSVQRLRIGKERVRISYATPLVPLYDIENLMDALFAVVEEIYNKKVIPAFIENKLEG